MVAVDKPPCIAVVGAGIAGLAAATRLARAGAQVIVYEANPYVGGRAHCGGETTFDHDGRSWTFRLEHGIHGIWRQYRNLRRLLDEVGKGDQLVDVGGQEFVAPDVTGRFGAWDFASAVRGSPLPSAMANLAIFTVGDFGVQALIDRPTKWLPAAADLTHAFAFDAATDIREYDDVSVAEYISGWPRLLQRLSGAITHSAFFREPEEVSLAAYMTGLQGYFVSDKRDTAFDVLTTDTGRDLLDPMCRAIEAAGGDVRLGEPVTKIAFRGAKDARISSKPRGKRVRTKVVDGVVLALDPPGLAKVTDGGPLQDALSDRRIPRGVASTVVRVWFTSTPSPSRAQTGVLHGLAADNFFWLHRLQPRFARWTDATGGGVIECHLYGDRATEAQVMSDGAIASRTVAVCEHAWPELRGSAVHAHVQRNAPTHVAFAPGVMSRLPAVETTIRNVKLCGDWIACDAPILYMERAVITALLAAKSIAGEVGLDASKVPDPLPAHPPARSIDAFRQVFRAMRSRGWLPDAAA